jgi:hypothetical protein
MAVVSLIFSVGVLEFALYIKKSLSIKKISEPDEKR